MIIKPYLTDFVRKDGKARVMIYCYDPVTRMKARIPTEFYLKPADWTGTEVHKKLPHASYMNPKIKRLVLDLEDYCNKHPGTSLQELKRGKSADHTPLTYFEHYIQMCKDGEIVKKQTREKMTPGYIRALTTSKKYFEKFGRKATWQEIGEPFFDRYVKHLRDLGFKQNTIKKAITHFKTITDHARRKGVHTNEDTKYFIAKEKSQKIRLTPDEVQSIIDLDLKEWPDLQAEQERFQVAYNLLLRFGDSIAINEKNILSKGNRHYLSGFTIKGRKEILLPLKESVYRILKKNKFKLTTSNADSNEKLKRIGMMARVNSLVTFTEFKNGKKIETRYKKYQKIETHTTRRSAARNLFDTGMPPEVIMTLGGWSTMKQLLDYIDIDLDYAASKAAEHPFFE